MKLPKIAAALLLAGGLVVADPALATVAVYFELDQLVELSDRIVRARVLEQREVLLPGERTTRTDTTLQVLETYKGTARETVTVRQLGGTTPAGNRLIVPGDASFVPGEEVVVFLLASETWPDVFVLTSLSQASYKVARLPTGAVLERDLHDIGFYDGSGVVHAEDVPVALSIFESAVRDLVEAR